MSLVRNIANGIADLVVRYASPGSKEWAEAMRGELASIESDWRALAWACSGMRVLFAIRPAPLRTLEDLQAEAQRVAELRRFAFKNGLIGTNRPLITLSVYIVWLSIRIGFGHHVLSGVVQLSGWLLFLPLASRTTRTPNAPDRDDPDGLVRFYMNDLRATSSFSPIFFMSLAGALVLFAGLEMEMGLGWRNLLPVPGLLVLAYFLAKHHNNRKRLAQIQASFGSELHE